MKGAEGLPQPVELDLGEVKLLLVDGELDLSPLMAQFPSMPEDWEMLSLVSNDNLGGWTGRSSPLKLMFWLG